MKKDCKCFHGLPDYTDSAREVHDHFKQLAKNGTGLTVSDVDRYLDRAKFEDRYEFPDPKDCENTDLSPCNMCFYMDRKHLRTFLAYLACKTYVYNMALGDTFLHNAGYTIQYAYYTGCSRASDCPTRWQGISTVIREIQWALRALQAGLAAQQQQRDAGRRQLSECLHRLFLLCSRLSLNPDSTARERAARRGDCRAPR